jgi:uncharacterized protein
MLSASQGRVVGSLIEKQLATPQQYPLTANAVLLACNQASNRDPVVAYTEDEVAAALDQLRELHLVRFVLPSHGRSVVRFRQVLDEVLGVDTDQLALLAVLLLRGPQTIGELRARTDRLTTFDSLSAVEHQLDRMAAHETPLVVRLPRRPGQKEERWQELLTADAAESGSPAATPAGPLARPDAGSTPDDDRAASGPIPEPPARGPAMPVPGDVVSALRDEVSALRGEVEALREALDTLRSSLGG